LVELAGLVKKALISVVLKYFSLLFVLTGTVDADSLFPKFGQGYLLAGRTLPINDKTMGDGDVSPSPLTVKAGRIYNFALHQKMNKNLCSGEHI